VGMPGAAGIRNICTWASLHGGVFYTLSIVDLQLVANVASVIVRARSITAPTSRSFVSKHRSAKLHVLRVSPGSAIMIFTHVRHIPRWAYVSVKDGCPGDFDGIAVAADQVTTLGGKQAVTTGGS